MANIPKKPKIDNVWWRGAPGKEIAWGRVERRGKPHRQSLETTDPRVARERVKIWLARLEGENWGEKPRRSYAEAADRFISEHLPRLKPRGAERYLQSLKVLTEFFEGKLLDDISSASLNDFEEWRRRQGVTSSTIRKDLWCLSSIFTCAMEWEWVEGNRVSAYTRGRAKRGLLQESPPRTRYCSQDEELELIRRCEYRRPWDVMLRTGVALTIDLGLRKEELLAADWTMIDMEKWEWFVPAALAKTGRKTGVGRTIPILPRSIDLLKKLPRVGGVELGPNDPLGRRTAPLILWHDDGGTKKRYFDLLPMLHDMASGGRSHVRRREMTKLFEKGLKLTPARREEINQLAEEQAWANEIPDLRWHDLRRTCGCRLLQDHGMSMEGVSKWLGHGSIQQTQRAYAFLEVAHLHRAVGTEAAIARSRAGLIT